MIKYQKKDMYQIVTDKVIHALENGVKPWACPWDMTNNSGNGLPMNFKSGNAYSGINIMLLWSDIVDKSFSSPYFLTFKQAVELGGNVKKGSKGSQIIYYKMIDIKNKNKEDKKEQIPMLKTYTIFNLDQIDGIESPKVECQSDFQNSSGFVEIPKIENLIERTGVKIVHKGANAFYSPSYDQITMPTKDRFSNSSDYYCTIWHELVHSTSASKRLDRSLKGKFGSKDYAFEELVAELGSAFCCADLGIIGKLQHESYIAYWLEKLSNDKRFIFKAASLASKAHQFLLVGKQDNKDIAA